MNLEAFLEKNLAGFETALLKALPEPAERPASLSKAVRYAVEDGGKRVRPVLCMASALACGKEPMAAIDAACAIEYLHSYTLVHDDLPAMDNDMMRRGKPSVHAKFGETLAILAGDWLQARAFSAIAPNEHARALLAELAAAAQGVVCGQVEDIEFAGSPSKDILDYVFAHKCGDLFAAACAMGAISASANAETAARLREFGMTLGIAFQLEDDLLDAEQSKADPDKAELSALSLFSPAEIRAEVDALTSKALALLDGLPGDVEPLRDLAHRLASRRK